MGDSTAKSAQEIVAALAACTESYDGLRVRVADHAYGVLRRVLSEVPLQRVLCAELSTEQRGYPVHSEHPAWARQLADVLLDPRRRHSEDVKRNVYEVCQVLCHEYATAGERPTMEYLATAYEVPVLSSIARDLYVTKSSAAAA